MDILKYIDFDRLKPVLDFISFTLNCDVKFVPEEKREIVYETDGSKPYKKNVDAITLPLKIDNTVVASIILKPLSLGNSQIALSHCDGNTPILSEEKLKKTIEKLLPLLQVTIEFMRDKAILKEKKELAEEAFNMQEITKKELETIFENSQVGIMYLQGGRFFVKGNQRLADILGWDSPEEMIGISMKSLHTSDDSFLKFGERYFDKLALGSRIHIEYELAKKNGEPVWCILSGEAVDKNTPADLNKGVIWIIDDISKRKELEEFKVDIEKIIRHDLKMPLNSIIGFPQVMIQDKSISEENKEYLQVILNSGLNMKNLIERSQNLHKIENGTYQLFMEETDVLSVIRQIEADLSEIRKQKKCNLVLGFDEKPATKRSSLIISTEKTLFYMTLSNLIKNAIEASPRENDVVININSEIPVSISISNKGLIPEDIRDTFFNKYVTRNKKGGTGLGTYSAKIMSNAIGADLYFKLAEKERTILTLTLK